MGILDGLDLADKAMAVHRYRSEIAAQNVANSYSPNYRRKEVVLRANDFAASLDGARATAETAHGGGGPADASDGAVAIASVRTVTGSGDERQQALQATSDMMMSKSAFELSAKAATLLKSMALSALEIGRGS